VALPPRAILGLAPNGREIVVKPTLSLGTAILFGLLTLAVTASAAPEAKPLVVRGGLGHLVLPGDRVDVRYDVYSGSKDVEGDLYLRTDQQQGYVRLRLQHAAPPALSLHRVIPARLLHGRGLLYYAVIRDPWSRRSLKLPAAGARAPSRAWILDKPVVVRLGTHRFGQTRKPEAVVARAGPNAVGFENNEAYHFGPQTFLVGRDRSIWLHDGLNQRLLVWAPGYPETVARTVPLPFFAADNDIALGPDDTVYVNRLLRDPPRLVLTRLTATGKVLWQRQLTGTYAGNSTFVLGSNSPLRLGPDGTLYCLVFMGLPGDEWGWMPVATATGRPLSKKAQRTGTHWPFQPVAGGLRLLGPEVYTPRDNTAAHELRYALIDRRNRVVRAWRVLSRSEISGSHVVPDLVGGDPVVVLDFAKAGDGQQSWEYEVLRLGRHKLRTQFSLDRAIFGDDLLADVRVGPDGNLYQLTSSPTKGAEIRRYGLD
jgi:hypothetical protein